MTDVLRNAFGIQEGSHVYIGATKRNVLLPARKVVFTDVTPRDDSTSNNSTTSDDGRWLPRCISALTDCEAFASGQTFQATSKARTKKRFCIEHVDAVGTQQGVPSLFYTDNLTEYVLGEPYASRPSSAVNGDANTLLSSERIGGLVKQIQTLNERIRRLLIQNEATAKPDHRGVLIHGYEGTGKSLLLDQLERIGSLRSVRVDRSKLDKGSVAKNREAIKSLFAQAVKLQPSLILMDDLAKLAPNKDDTYADVIASELKGLAGSRVLIVATCRAPGDVNDALTRPSRLLSKLELSIPDALARASILGVMLEKSEDPSGSIIANVSLRTHGFTGEDLLLLVAEARDNAYSREANLEYLDLGSPSCSLDNGLDGAVHSQAAAHSEQARVNGASDSDEPTGGLSVEDFDAALRIVRPTALREIFFEKPQINWTRIGGSEAVKERFDEIISWPIHGASDVAELGVPAEKGVLLYGPPGCSKTMTAQAVANHYELNFIAVKGAELISMYVGESERSVREVFRKARAAAPCVIFFDEIDSIASERDSAGSKGLNVLTTLLNEMDGFEALKGVLVLAATNKPDALDPAIMRPGRFDSHIYLGPPSEVARKAIFTINTKGIKLMHELDYGELAKATEGYSGAEIVKACNSAKKEALRRHLKGDRTGVSMTDLRKGVQATSRGISDDMLSTYQRFRERAEQQVG